MQPAGRRARLTNVGLYRSPRLGHALGPDDPRRSVACALVRTVVVTDGSE